MQHPRDAVGRFLGFCAHILLLIQRVCRVRFTNVGDPPYRVPTDSAGNYRQFLDFTQPKISSLFQNLSGLVFCLAVFSANPVPHNEAKIRYFSSVLYFSRFFFNFSFSRTLTPYKLDHLIPKQPVKSSTLFDGSSFQRFLNVSRRCMHVFEGSSFNTVQQF